MRTIPGTPKDINHLIPWIADKTACLMWAGPLVHFPLEISRLLDEIEYSPDNSFCLKHDGILKAFGQLLSKQAASLHMARIIVEPGSRGQGYGCKLCKDLIQIARERNVRALTLNVYRDNLAGLGLYVGLGFKLVADKSTADYVHMIKKIK